MAEPRIPRRASDDDDAAFDTEQIFHILRF